jgi:hypothetical protein
MSIELRPFKPNATVAIAATPTSARSQLAGSGEQLRIANKGPNAAFVAFGNSSLTATTADLQILAGTVELFTNPDNKGGYVAAICAAGETATLTFTTGDGE